MRPQCRRRGSRRSGSSPPRLEISIRTLGDTHHVLRLPRIHTPQLRRQGKVWCRWRALNIVVLAAFADAPIKAIVHDHVFRGSCNCWNNNTGVVHLRRWSWRRCAVGRSPFAECGEFERHGLVKKCGGDSGSSTSTHVALC